MARPPIDIPQVLAVLRPTEEWGPGGSSSATYDQLVAGWRGITPVPTRQEMEDTWTFLLSGRRKARTRADLITAIGNLSNADRNKLLAAIAADWLRDHPRAARALGIPIDGDEPDPA